MLSELLIILALTLANGFFAGSELAIVSARAGRLESMANAGSRPARQALNLAENPDRFLATVQVGITLIGTFSAAFGGARIGSILAGWIAQIPALEPHAETLGLLIVVVVITYLSLVLGELVPKRLAIQNAERLAIIAAPVMTVLSALTRPIVALLTLSVAGVMRVIGQRATGEDAVTEEDIEYLVREGTESGVVEHEEARIIERVFRFTDRPVSAIMTPRTQFTAVSVDQSLSEVMGVFNTSGFSRLPLYEESVDHVVGVLHVKDLVGAFASGANVDLESIARPPLFVVESLHGDDVLLQLRQQGAQIAFVIDEYGQIMGLVTIEDLIEELVGEIRDEYDHAEEPRYVKREDGSWLIDGLEPYEKVATRVGLPHDDERRHTSLAGVIMDELGRVANVGDKVTLADHVLEVVDMDGRRIDKVLVTRIPPLPDVE
ncbi:MAG: HlyC/CorC family transporter [Chloroflexi bacterium]|nr:HlyC/CorC family transporter [Chloroflexota bacterium]